MKKNNKKKKLMAAAAALGLIAAISGTFAWITSQDQRVNRVESAAVVDGSTTIIEKWEPKPLVPGTEAVKEVAVSNTGAASVFVRLSYEEVLKHLTDKGEQKSAPSTGTGAVAGAKYTYVANDPGLDKHMPINYNMSKMIADGFEEVPAINVTGLETDTKLYVKGGKSPVPVTGGYAKSYEKIIVHEYDTGKYQAMECKIDDDWQSETSLNAKDWKFTVSKLEYGYYDKGYTNKVVNWAESSLEDEAGNPTGNALLGTNGLRYGVDYDYRIAALGLTAIPGKTPAASNIDPLLNPVPTGAGKNSVQADIGGLGKSAIKVKYTAAVVDSAGLAAATNNWIYNPEDGWFYYTQPLTSGTTTANLMESLVFESDLGKEYTNATYDLVVKLETIQATKEALTDAAGWKLDTTTATNVTTKAICDKLAP
ncbi:hypothetical protein [Enterococcus sp. AZ072]|uniref:hypothetical protein n=1 Tax=unclassified Enterococcus TaxID=2608891 RepID=UPI003D297DC6